MRPAVILPLVFALFAASVTSAEDSAEPKRGRTRYVFGNIGLYDPAGDIRELHTGWYVSGGVGLRLHPNVAVESTLACMRSNGSPGDLWAIPLTVGARLIYPTPVFEPYAGLGYGVFYIDLNKPGGNDASLTLVDSLSLGTDIWLNRNVALNVDLKYQHTNFVLTGPDIDASGAVFTLGVRMTF